MTSSLILSLESLDKRFGSRQVLQGVSLQLHTGEAILLCGPNGAGKSTLLRILSGLEKPDRCLLDLGQGIQSWSRSRERLFKSTLYLHQHPYMFDGSVRYNLAYALPRHLRGKARHLLVDQAMAWAGLEHLQETPAKSLSGGERQRVSLARAWLRKPRILFLDEPTANLDHASRQRVQELLSPLKEAGMALVIASHDVHHFASLADHSLHLHEGHLIDIEATKLRPIHGPENTPSLRTQA
jgi:tungstate transport system ATP-binding protein